MWIILAVLVLTAAVFLYEQYEHEAVQITEYMLPCENLKTEHELKFCVISDLHNNKKRTEDALLETVKAYQPAAFLVCGDMVNKHKTDNSAALHFLTRLTELAPVFYSFGNHESELKENAPDAWEDYVAALPEGCYLLDNQTMELAVAVPETEAVLVSGLTLPVEFYGKGALLTDETKLPELAVPYKLHKNPYHILLAHNPEYVKMYGKYNPDLILSGHLHGGLVRLPFLGGLVSPRYRFPKQDAGIYKHGNAALFISRGLGSHTIPLRAFNRAELTILTLTKEQ